MGHRVGRGRLEHVVGSAAHVRERLQSGGGSARCALSGAGRSTLCGAGTGGRTDGVDRSRTVFGASRPGAVAVDGIKKKNQQGWFRKRMIIVDVTRMIQRNLAVKNVAGRKIK